MSCVKKMGQMFQIKHLKLLYGSKRKLLAVFSIIGIFSPEVISSIITNSIKFLFIVETRWDQPKCFYKSEEYMNCYNDIAAKITAQNQFIVATNDAQTEQSVLLRKKIIND